MITIHGVPISVHARKAIVTAILKDIDHRVEPVIPFNPPPNWATLSPTGLIPAMQDGDFAVAEFSAICLYLERKQPAPAILPAGERDYSRAMFLDGYSGWVFRSLVHGLFFQKVINPVILKGTTDQAVDRQHSRPRSGQRCSAIWSRRSTENIWRDRRSAWPISASSRT